MNKVLYVYGYGSTPADSSTLKEVKSLMTELGYDLVSIEYNQVNPLEGIVQIENFINENKIDFVIGHSLGGFITLCLNSNIKKVVINPCLDPQFELHKIDKSISLNTIKEYESLYKWLRSGINTPWVYQSEDVIGIFGTSDELFNYYEDFRKIYPIVFKINSGHRPKKEDFTKEIKTKIKEFFS